MNTNTQTIETAKHTPGPWEACISSNSDTYMIFGPRNEDIVAHVPEFMAMPIVTANANLIAAAPDMLAALQSVDREIEALIGEAQWYASGNQAANLCRKVRAAIAKATGAAAGKTIAPPTPQPAESTAYELPCSL